MRRVERQELYCHNCDRYIQFDLDLSVDGNYRLDCPNCGHDHYRVVKDGKITDVRFDQSPSQQGMTGWTLIQSAATSSASTYSTYGGVSSFLYQSWMNTTCTTA